MNPGDSHSFDIKKSGAGLSDSAETGITATAPPDPDPTEATVPDVPGSVEATAPDVPGYPQPKHARLRLVLGWVGIAITVIISSVWAYWGAIENFHECWYSESIWENLFMLRTKSIGTSTYNGLPTNKCASKHIIDQHAKLAGVHRIKTHALRHSHASLLISLGENALVVRDRLGHEDIETTLGTYGHLYPNTNRAVADKLSNLITVETSEKAKRVLTSNQHIKRNGEKL